MAMVYVNTSPLLFWIKTNQKLEQKWQQIKQIVDLVLQTYLT